MKTIRLIARSLLLLALLSTINHQLSTAHAQGTAFTYNGKLNDGANPATGSYDLRFTLCDAVTNGNAIGALTNAATGVTNGLFMAALDFGGVFNGSNYWLEIAARTNGGASFSTLSPRQPITPTPYAIYSANAGSASSVAAGNIVGTVPLAQLPAAVVTNNETGAILNGTFTGNGGGLTNLPAASLTGTVSDSQLSTNIARLNIPNTTTQATAVPIIVSGFLVSTINLNGGSGYTSVPLVTITDVSGSNAVITAAVASGVVTSLTVQNPGIHYSSGATLTIAPPPSNAYQTFGSGNIFNGVSTFNNSSNSFAGSFIGNAGGLTNLNAASLTGTGTLPVTVMPANVAFLNSNQTFTRVNLFTNQLVAGIPPISSNDNFVVRPATNIWLGIKAGWITSGMVIESVNDALSANVPLEFRGNPSVFTTGNVGIGTTTPSSALEVDGWDCTIRIRNSVDAIGGFIGNTSTSVQLGMYNPSGSTQGVMPAGTAKSFFAFDQSGKVGSVVNGMPSSASYRNLLDDGSGNMSMAGNLYLPATTANAGIIYSGGNTLIHSYGSGNFFAGAGAGNLTMSMGGGGNTGIGFAALNSNTTGWQNEASGQYALYGNTTGYNNTANGSYALWNNTTGNNNSANGQSALANNTTGSKNTANGADSLQNNTNGIQNTANGYQALQFNTSGGNNEANGAYALQNNTTGGNNTANGYGALDSNTTGGNNTANGYQSLYWNTIGNYDSANGANALNQNTTGSYNTANGWGALNQNTTGYENVANGNSALYGNTSGPYNTANGSMALNSNTTADRNTANGAYSLRYTTTGRCNTADGVDALNQNTTGSYNIAVGNQAGFNIITGSSNIDIGNMGLFTDTNIIRIGSGQTQAFIAGVITGNGAGLTNVNLTGLSASSALGNEANGYQALQSNTTGWQNTANGYLALQNNTTGTENEANGAWALQANTTGYNNTANGTEALQDNTTGGNNTANGQAVLYNNATGSQNVGNGNGALFNNTTGNNNVANGLQALSSNNGNNNTANGFQALFYNTTGNNNIAEGYQAGYNITTGNNNIDIGNMGLATDTNIIRIGSGQTQAFIAGVITGNGAGLTNLNAASLTGTATLPAGVLPANVALLNSNQTFTGVNVFTNNLVVGTPASFINNFQVRPAANKILQIRTGVSVGSGMAIESLNDAASANMPLEFRGSPNVFTTGNVGIGTINPAMALDVNGSINASGNVYLPTTTASTGIIYSGGSTLMHNYGSQSVYVGSSAGNLTMSGGDNAAIGAYALQSDTTGYGNTANGFETLKQNTSGNWNTASGASALEFNTTGNNNVANGVNVLQYNTTGSGNTANGQGALQNNTTGNDNVANGFQALYSNTNGNDNTANGSWALYNNTTGGNNAANGKEALHNNTTGNDNTANGSGALYQNTTGSGNTANGQGALANNTTGDNNTANGQIALENNTTGHYNTANGFYALQLNISGSLNTADGMAALDHNTTGDNNTAVGQGALQTSSTGSYNTALGVSALYNSTTASNNIGLGYNAGYNISTGSSNIDIGNMGLDTDTNIIRIGDGQTQTFIAGQIIGDGSGLTNLNVGQLPSAVLTNNAVGVTLAGSFTGNAAGLTNVPTSAITGGLTVNLAVLVPGGGTNTLCFTNGVLTAIQ